MPFNNNGFDLDPRLTAAIREVLLNGGALTDAQIDAGAKNPAAVSSSGAILGADGSPVSGATYRAPPAGALCVDSATGSDSNAGTEALPLRTLAAARALMVNGSAVALKRGGQWREAIDVSALSNTTITQYGDLSLPMPMLDASAVAPALMWSKTGGRTNVYQCAWPHGLLGGYLYVWEDDVPLTPVADQAACDALPGSYVNLGNLTAAGSTTVYINPTDSQNPQTSGHVYEITKLDMLAFGGLNFGNGNKFDGIWARRCSTNNAGIHGDFLSNCMATESAKHHLWVNVGGKGENLVAYRFLNTATGYGGGQMFCSYVQTPISTLVTTYKNIYAHGSGYTLCSGFIQHNGSAGSKVASTSFDGFYCYNLDGFGSLQDVPTVTFSNAWAERMATCLTTDGALTADNITWIPYSVDGRFPSGTIQGFLAQSGAISNLKFAHAGTEFTNGVIQFNTTGYSLRLTQSTLVNARGSGNYTKVAAATVDNISAQVDRCIGYGINRLADFATANGDMTGNNYNCWYKPSGNFDATIKGVATASLAALKTSRPDLEVVSVNTDPALIGNVLRGDFSLFAPVTVGGVLAGAVKFQRRPDWAVLRDAWDQGFLGIDGIRPPKTRTSAGASMQLGISGALATGQTYAAIVMGDARYSRLNATLSTAGSTATTVTISTARSAYTLATITFAANATVGTIAWTNGVVAEVYAGDRLIATVATAGVGAAGLSVGVA